MVYTSAETRLVLVFPQCNGGNTAANDAVRCVWVKERVHSTTGPAE